MEYIDDTVRHFRRSIKVKEKAIQGYNYLAKNTTFEGWAPSMKAMTLVFVAMREVYESVPSDRWTGRDTCSYNTLTSHANELKPILEKSPDFPNLKYVKNW